MAIDTATRSSTKQQAFNASNGSEMLVPSDGWRGLKENWRSDIVSGFILFMIALPLSLGIAMASGVPPLAGILAAIVGGVIVSLISGSYVTINGPAAGLIIVILASVERLGGGVAGYRATLAATVVAGALLVVLGLLKAGQLGKFFPPPVVHGMLAAIGIIIMSKQLPYVLGVAPPAKEPIALILAVPAMLLHLNPAVSAIGFVSLLLLIGHSMTSNQLVKKIPAPILVVLVALGLGAGLGLERAHGYDLLGVHYAVDPGKCLVALPKNILNGLVMPDFSQSGSYAFWLSVISITLVQGIESLLSCAAVDRLDLYRRQSKLSRDMAAIGFGSMVSGLIGGLPMIAEIVRSTANVANGARTRFSNFFHGVFILVFVLFGAALINRIPLAALAALLVVTGYRLASPRVFKEMYAIGLEETIVFVTTIVATLSTDLLIGVFVGVAAELILHVGKGASLPELFRVRVASAAHADQLVDVGVGGVLTFSNYLILEKQLDRLPPGKAVRLDLSAARLIDHSAMEHLHHYAESYTRCGGSLDIVGLDKHKRASDHPLAARRLPARSYHGHICNFM